MINPPHPGEILRDELRFIAEQLEVPAAVLAGEAPISESLAASLELAGVSTAQAWLALQRDYDRSQVHE